MANLPAPIPLYNVSLAGVASVDTDFTVTRPFTVVDVACLANASVGGITMTVKRSASSLSNAMACDTINALIRTSSLVIAQRTFAINDVVRVTLSGANTGTALITLIPTAINGNS